MGHNPREGENAREQMDCWFRMISGLRRMQEDPNVGTSYVFGAQIFGYPEIWTPDPKVLSTREMTGCGQSGTLLYCIELLKATLTN